MMRRVADPADDLMEVDVNDGVLMLLCAAAIEERWPGQRARLAEVMPEAIEAAMTTLGLFGGLGNIAKLCDLPYDEVERSFMLKWTGKEPAR